MLKKYILEKNSFFYCRINLLFGCSETKNETYKLRKISNFCYLYIYNLQRISCALFFFFFYSFKNQFKWILLLKILWYCSALLSIEHCILLIKNAFTIKFLSYMCSWCNHQKWTWWTVQILDKAVRISHIANTLGNGMHPPILPPAVCSFSWGCRIHGSIPCKWIRISSKLIRTLPHTQCMSWVCHNCI